MEKKYIEVNEGELIRWRGLWSAEIETYALGDVVAHAKSGYGTCTYKATVGHVPAAATEPEVGGSWETVWEVFLVGGQNGDGAGTGDVLSSGVAGGQTLIGGTGAGESLDLEGTAHATKGPIKMQVNGGKVGVGIASPEAALEVVGDGVGYDGGILITDETFQEKWGIVSGADKSLWIIPKSGSGAIIKFEYTGGMDIVGAIEADGVVSSAGLTLTGGPIKRAILSKTANYTITDLDPDIVVIGAITALNHTTITLPTAADNIGRIITVIINGDPGTKNVIVDGEGSETINGATTKTNSDIYSYLRLLCNGTGWNIIGSAGTWT